MSTTAAGPAGFWPRYVAWSLDAVLVAIPVLVLGAGWLAARGATLMQTVGALGNDLLLELWLSPMLEHDTEASIATLLQSLLSAATAPQIQAGVGALREALAWWLLPPLAAWSVLALAWHTAFEAMPGAATPGKRALGLFVCSATGDRLPTGRVALRQAAGLLSWLSLNLGHLSAALAPRHQALHDHIARARVMTRPAARPFPGWALAWLLAQGAALAAGCLWLSSALETAIFRASGA